MDTRFENRNKGFKTLKDEIDNDKQKALTDTDIKLGSFGRIKIITYPELSNYLNIEDVIGNYKGIIIHYPVESINTGHYCSLWIDEEANTLMYFDSYGMSIDQDISRAYYLLENYSDDVILKLPHMIKDWVNRTGGTFSSNTYVYQDIRVSTYKTCGCHCIFRLNRTHLSHSEYHQFLKFKSLTPDEIVALATQLLI